MANFLNCRGLATLTDFTTYIASVNDITAFQPVLLEVCKNEICAALWGVGNSDISGIGVSNAGHTC